MRGFRVLVLLWFGALALWCDAAAARPVRPARATPAIWPVQDSAQEPVRLSDVGVFTLTDLRVFSAAAALRLAGVGGETAASDDGGFAEKLLAEIKVHDAGAVPAIKEFFRQHRVAGADLAAQVAPYLSLALAVSDPPAFEPVVSVALLPADVRAIGGFLPLLRRLFSGSNLRAVFTERSNEIQSAALKVFAAAPPLIAQRLAYLHTAPITLIQGQARVVAEKGKQRVISVRNRHRRMFIVFDPLAPGDSVLVRNDLSVASGSDAPDEPGDDFVIVAGPTESREVREFGRAYSRYLLDPIIDRVHAELTDPKTHQPAGLSQNILSLLVKAKEPAANVQNSPSLVVRESLVYAIEAGIARFSNTNPALAADIELQNRFMLARQFDAGAVLGFHFYQALKGLESAGVDFKDLFVPFLRSVNFDVESKRPDQFEEIRAAYESKYPRQKVAAPPSLAGADAALTADLITADRLIVSKDYKNAEPLLRRLEAAHPNNARVLYGLAQVVNGTSSPEELDPKTDEDDRIAEQEKRLGQAIQLYLRAIDAAAVPAELWIQSRSFFAVGKIYEFKDLAEEAIEYYENTMKLGDVPSGAYQEALAAKTRLSSK